MSLPKPYYHDERAGITIYCGDNRDILPHLQKVDLVLTDPPYGIGEDGGKCRTRGSKVPNHFRGGWDNKTPTKEVFDLILSRSKVQMIFGGNYFSDKLPVSRGWIYWRKLMGGDFGDGELCWTSMDMVLKEYTKPNKGLFNEHPTQKPLSLITFCILHADRVALNSTILDPFMGSGTTLRAAKDLGRKAIGIEISEEYCRIAVRRLQQEVFNFSDGKKALDKGEIRHG